MADDPGIEPAAGRPQRVAIVIATYDERENVERLIPALLALPGEPVVQVVDDGSPDGTGDEVRAQMERAPGRVRLVERQGKLGYGSAVVAGFREVLAEDFDAVVTLDADFSHDPAAIPELLAALAHADLAIGSRYVGGVRILNWSVGRLLLSWGANLYVNALLRFGISDCTSGFRAYRARVLRSIDLDRASSRGYSFLVELLELVVRAGFRTAEVPIVYTERRVGESKMSGGVIAESVVRPWLLVCRRLLGR